MRFVSYLKNKKLFLIIGGGVLLSFIVGYQIAFHSWDRQVSISLDPLGGDTRGLASEEDLKKVVTVPSEEYSDKQNLFKKAKMIKGPMDGSLPFVVGNLLFTDSKGNSDFVCKNFSKVKLLFEAYGLIIEGERVVMTLTADCKTHTDHQYIGPFSLPVQKIINSPITKSEFHEEGLKFENVALRWPQSWVLLEAHFTRETGFSFSVISKIPESEEDIFVIQF